MDKAELRTEARKYGVEVADVDKWSDDTITKDTFIELIIAKMPADAVGAPGPAPASPAPALPAPASPAPASPAPALPAPAPAPAPAPDLPHRIATDPVEEARKIEKIKQCLRKCGIGEKDANNYAIDLIDYGCDGPADVAGLEEHQFPKSIKPLHLQKICSWGRSLLLEDLKAY